VIWDYIWCVCVVGLVVLLIFVDFDELIGLSDTIHVILRGRFVG